MKFVFVAFIWALLWGSVCFSDENLVDYFPVRDFDNAGRVSELTYLETDGCLLIFRTYRGNDRNGEYVSKVSIQPKYLKTDPQDVIVSGDKENRKSVLIAWLASDELIEILRSENTAFIGIYKDEYGPMESVVERLSTQKIYEATKRLAARMLSSEAGNFSAKNYRESYPDKVSHVLYGWTIVFDLILYVEREKKHGLIAAMNEYKKTHCVE